MDWAAPRSASASGRYGTLSPSSAHWPESTVKPRPSASRVTSLTSRDLPDPGVAADQRGHRPAGLGVVEQREQAAELVVPPDHAPGRHP